MPTDRPRATETNADRISSAGRRSCHRPKRMIPCASWKKKIQRGARSALQRRVRGRGGARGHGGATTWPKGCRACRWRGPLRPHRPADAGWLLSPPVPSALRTPVRSPSGDLGQCKKLIARRSVRESRPRICQTFPSSAIPGVYRNRMTCSTERENSQEITDGARIQPVDQSSASVVPDRFHGFRSRATPPGPVSPRFRARRSNSR